MAIIMMPPWSMPREMNVAVPFQLSYVPRMPTICMTIVAGRTLGHRQSSTSAGRLRVGRVDRIGVEVVAIADTDARIAFVAGFLEHDPTNLRVIIGLASGVGHASVDVTG